MNKPYSVYEGAALPHPSLFTLNLYSSLKDSSYKFSGPIVPGVVLEELGHKVKL
jgi:hypothetical protein